MAELEGGAAPVVGADGRVGGVDAAEWPSMRKMAMSAVAELTATGVEETEIPGWC